jgi:hypothetical protein
MQPTTTDHHGLDLCRGDLAWVQIRIRQVYPMERKVIATTVHGLRPGPGAIESELALNGYQVEKCPEFVQQIAAN